MTYTPEENAMRAQIGIPEEEYVPEEIETPELKSTPKNIGLPESSVSKEYAIDFSKATANISNAIAKINKEIITITKNSKKFIKVFIAITKRVFSVTKFFVTTINNLRRLGIVVNSLRWSIGEGIVELDTKTLGILNSLSKRFLDVDLAEKAVNIVQPLETIKNKFDNFVNYLKSLFGIIENLRLNINLEEDVKFIGAPLNAIKNSFSSFVDYLKSMARESKETRLNIDLEEDVKSVNNPLELIKNSFVNFIEYLKSLVINAKDLGANIVTSLADGIQESISKIPSVFELLNDEIKKGFDRQNKMIEGIVSSIPGFNIFGNKKNKKKLIKS